MDDWHWRTYLNERKEGLSSAVVQTILDDLTDRRGLRHEWDNIDDDIQKEIIDKWTALVKELVE